MGGSGGSGAVAIKRKRKGEGEIKERADEIVTAVIVHHITYRFQHRNHRKQDEKPKQGPRERVRESRNRFGSATHIVVVADGDVMRWCGGMCIVCVCGCVSL